MIYPVLYKRGTTDFTNNGKGVLVDAFDIKVKEVINDIFTLDFSYPITSRLGTDIMNGDIVKVDASNVLRNQKFRVMTITQNTDLTITVHCVHKTFDTATDYVKGPLNLQHASCEYALNMLFNKSMKSKNYVGVSDIQNAQNFSCVGKQLGDAIVGSTGSIIDTYGLGPQIERDNSGADTIKVLKRRGKDTNILVSYGKNITGYKCVIDEQSLATVLIPFAQDTTTQEKVIGEALYAPNYEDFGGELYIVEVDMSDRFGDNEPITMSALRKKGEAYMLESKCNIPKLTYTIDFEKLDTSTIPSDYNLEKLYAVNIGDTLIVRHRYFNTDTQARVNSIEYDPISQKYTKLVFGDVRASFGENINNGVIVGPPGKDGTDGQDGKPGANGKTYYTWIKYADTPTSGMSDDPTGKTYLGIAYNKETQQESNNYDDYTWSKIKGADASLNDFPDTLPDVPKLQAELVGLTGIDLRWTFENKMYYTYELYASQVPDFNPTAFDKVYEGKASSYLHQAQPNESWYFRVRAINSYGHATEFSSQVIIMTNKQDNFDKYFSNLAVDSLVADIFSVNHMKAGTIKGQWIDAKNLTVTDGNGKRTLDVDSFGRVTLQPTNMKVLIDDKVEFTDSVGTRNLALYGGQLCAFNSLNNKFLGTTGAIIADKYGIFGSGFLLSKHCNHFLIGKDANWDDIYTNRAPQPNYPFDIDFVNHQIIMRYPLLIGEVNMRGNSLYDVNTGYIKDWYGFGWKSHEDGYPLLEAEGHRLKFRVPVSFDGNQLMNPTLYTDRFYFTNGHLAFQQSPGTSNVMSTGCHWDFNGLDIVNARLIDCQIGLGVINQPYEALNPIESPTSTTTSSTFDEIDVVETHTISSVDTPKLDVSNVSNKDILMLDDNNIDYAKLLTILVKEIKELKAEVRQLKEITK